MHRLVINAPKGVRVDHKDSNGLNNQRHNLRIATGSQNSCNQRKSIEECSSQYKGVSFHRNRNTFEAHIMKNGAAEYIGSFYSELAAAMAYDLAAIRLHKEFALINGVDYPGYMQDRVVIPRVSKYKYVSPRSYPGKRPWEVIMKINGKSKYFGCFATEELAAEAVKQGRIKYGLYQGENN